MSTVNPLRTLTRKDKWYLGGGGRLLWAPLFPAALHRPGFWDPAHYYNFEFGPLFTWTLLDEHGTEIDLAAGTRTWNPALLKSRYRVMGGAGLGLTEERFVLPIGVACTTIRIRNSGRSARRLHLVVWTAQPSSPSGDNRVEECTFSDGRIGFRRTITPSGRPGITIAALLGISPRPTSHEIRPSEGSLQGPDWRLTPFAESFAGGTFPDGGAAGPFVTPGLVFAALHHRVRVRPGETAVVTAGVSLAPTPADAGTSLSIALRQVEPAELSIAAWREHFAGVPSFDSSDPFFNSSYWHRWYGLRLNMIAVSEGHYHHPFVCEGIGYFRAPISYSAFCHVMENRWRHMPELARGSISTFLENQRPDGGMRGYIDVHHYRQEMFYHADWGRALRALHRIHPSKAFLAEVYGGLARYAGYFDRERDREKSGLYDIVNHYETGQEYMHRYTVVDPRADHEHWGNVFRLKGIDVTVYVYELKQTLAWMADILGRAAEAAVWLADAARTKEAILDRMWDPAAQMFFDVNPATGLRTGVKAATCFYPFLTDMVTAEHLPALTRHLLNPAEFLTPYPAPASSADDAMFSAEPLWKGTRMNCPWNGRVWPMTNSHLMDALGLSATRFGDRRLRKAAADFLTRFVRMMFFDGDPSRPNSFEHYNPLTGRPSEYRGIDDYQHSWVNDLILRYVAGITPDAHGVTVDPFPFGLDWFVCDHVIVAGHRIRVEGRGTTFTVTVDDRKPVTGRSGTALFIQLEGNPSRT